MTVSKPDRRQARKLARDHLERGDALGWFEVLYAASGGDANMIPWADRVPNRHLVRWLEEKRIEGVGMRALVVGCGLGDDAEELARRGFDVVAFDISPTAIEWCRRRFPESSVGYVEADLLNPPDSWDHTFDFVLESYTLQSLPPHLRGETIRDLPRFLAPGGTLLVICRGRDPEDGCGSMPWPLTKDELAAFRSQGLDEVRFEDFQDDEDPPVRRFRVEYCAPRVSTHRQAFCD